MDFDKPKVYGDTSITDGLVLYDECRFVFAHPSFISASTKKTIQEQTRQKVTSA